MHEQDAIRIETAAIVMLHTIQIAKLESAEIRAALRHIPIPHDYKGPVSLRAARERSACERAEPNDRTPHHVRTHPTGPR